MNKISVKKQKFKKSSMEPVACSAGSVHFLFSVTTKPKQIDKQKSSFNSELRKITLKIGPVLEKNSLKQEVNSRVNSINQFGLPFRRRARSSSPPKDFLKIVQREVLLFPGRVPVIPVKIRRDFYEEDDELKRIKEEYLRILDSAQDTKPTENEEFYDDEEQEFIESIIASLSGSIKHTSHKFSL